jgi:hypothetical protein
VSDGVSERSERSERAPARASRWSRPVVVLVIAVAVSVSLRAAEALRWTAGKVPLADYAGWELRLRDMPAEIPLVGVYSREGWAHPGPIVMWFAAPLQWLFGVQGIFVAAALVSLAAAVVIAWAVNLAWPPVPAAGVLVVLGVWIVRAFAAGVADPWNPTSTVLALLAAALCSLSCRPSLAAAVAAVVAASVAAQAHAACLFPAAVLMVWVGWQQRARWKLLAGLTAALWIGPLVDLLFGEHNLYHLVGDLLAGDGTRLGYGPALRSLAATFDPRQALSRGHLPIAEGTLADQPLALGAVVLAVISVLSVAIVVRGEGATRRWAATVVAGVAVAWISLAGATEPVYPHVAAWVAVLPAAGLSVVVAALAERSPAPVWPCVAAAAGLLVVAGAAPASVGMSSVSADDVPTVAAAVVARVGGEPVVLADDDQFSAGFVVAVANEIERLGGRAIITDPWGADGAFGDERTYRSADACRPLVTVGTRRSTSGAFPEGDIAGDLLAAVPITDRGTGALAATLTRPSTCE